MKRRYLSRAELRCMKEKQHWGKCWNNQPKQMELNRLQATIAANKSRVIRLNAQREYIKNWPEKMSSNEYKGLLSEVAQKAKKKGLKPDSLRRKFQKHKFITFDPIQGAWINHARLNQIGGDQGGVP